MREEGEWLLQSKGLREWGDHNNTSIDGLGHMGLTPPPLPCARHTLINNDALQTLQTTAEILIARATLYELH